MAVNLKKIRSSIELGLVHNKPEALLSLTGTDAQAALDEMWKVSYPSAIAKGIAC